MFGKAHLEKYKFQLRIKTYGVLKTKQVLIAAGINF